MDLTQQPPFPPGACPVCGRPGQDGHFCEACIDELVRRGIDWEMMGPEEMRAALAAAPQAEEEAAPQPAAAPEKAPEAAPADGAKVRWGVLITACGVLALMFWFIQAEAGDQLAYWSAGERVAVEGRITDIKTTCLQHELVNPGFRANMKGAERVGRKLREGRECRHVATYEFSFGGNTYTIEHTEHTDYEHDPIIWPTETHGFYKSGEGKWKRVTNGSVRTVLKTAVGALFVCAVALYFVWRELRKLRRGAG